MQTYVYKYKHTYRSVARRVRSTYQQRPTRTASKSFPTEPCAPAGARTYARPPRLCPAPPHRRRRRPRRRTYVCERLLHVTGDPTSSPAPDGEVRGGSFVYPVPCDATPFLGPRAPIHTRTDRHRLAPAPAAKILESFLNLEGDTQAAFSNAAGGLLGFAQR